MEKRPRNLHPLKTPIENKVRELFRTALGYELCQVECRILESSDIVVNIERKNSATENFLLQQNQPELACDIGLTINQTIKGKLAIVLMHEFGLAIIDISLLQPAASRNFGFLVLVNRQRLPHTYQVG